MHAFFCRIWNPAQPLEGKRVDVHGLSESLPEARCVGLFSSDSSALRAQRAGATSQLVNHLLAGRAMTDCCFQFPAQALAASNEASLAGMKRPCWPLGRCQLLFLCQASSRNIMVQLPIGSGSVTGGGRLLLLVTIICSGEGG